MIKTLIKEKLILIRTHLNKSSVLVGVCSIFFMFSLSGSGKTSDMDITGITCSVTMTAFAAAVCTISDMHEDKSKFGKYLLAAPADISDISAAKYFFTFLVHTAAAVLAALFIIADCLIWGTEITLTCFAPTFIIYGFSMTFYSLYNLISLKYGDDTANNTAALIIIGISLLAFVYALFGDLEFIAGVYEAVISMSGKLPLIAAGYAGVSLVFMLGGFMLSKRIRYIF